jgi:hypothetical protein
MTRYAKRKLKYSLNENFNLLPYVEWDQFVTLTLTSGMRVTLSYLYMNVIDLLQLLTDNRLLRMVVLSRQMTTDSFPLS